MAACWGLYIERVGATAIRLILLRATQLRHVQSTLMPLQLKPMERLCGGLSMFLAWKRIGISAGAGLSKLSLGTVG